MKSQIFVLFFFKTLFIIFERSQKGFSANIFKYEYIKVPKIKLYDILEFSEKFFDSKRKDIYF